MSSSHQSSSRIMDVLEVTQVFGLLAKTAFGPKGYFKAILRGDNNSSTIFTKNGGIIFKSIVVTHPIGSIVVRLCSDIAEHGDGTLLGILFCTELLRQGVQLVVEGCHPVVVHEGFIIAKGIIKDAIQKLRIIESESLSLKTLCSHVCFSVLSSKLQPHFVSELADLTLRCFTDETGALNPAMDIHMVPLPGGETEVITGMVIAQGPRDSKMPRKLAAPKILLLSCDLPPASSSSTSLVFNSAEEHKGLVGQERDRLKYQLDTIVSLGANVIISTHAISGEALQALAQHGIFALRHVREQDVKALARALKLHTVQSLFNLPKGVEGIVGEGSSLTVATVQHTIYTYIDLGPHANVRTLMAGGWADFRIFQNISAVKQAISAIRQVLKDKHVLPGAGATEIALASAIREYSTSQPLAHPHYKRILKGFCKALEFIPVCLAENAGFSRTDINIAIANAKSQQNLQPRGLDLDTLSAIEIPRDRQVFDTYYSKLVALNIAVDTAGLLLRIDKIVKGADLLPIHTNPSNPTALNLEPHDAIPSDQDTAQSGNDNNAKQSETSKLRREFRPPKISDGATARSKQRNIQRKANETKQFYSKEQTALRQRAETVFKQQLPQDQITQRKRMMQLSRKERERIENEARD